MTATKPELNHHDKARDPWPDNARFLATAHRWILGGEFVFNPVTPAFALWFLLSLFFWRLALPYLAKIRHVVLWSTALAIGIGFLSTVGPQYSMSRTIGFLPLFLLGWKLRQMGLRKTLDRPWFRYAGIGMITVWAVAMYVFRDHFPPGMFSMRSSYSDEFLVAGAIGRTLLLVGGAATTLSFLTLVPRRRIPLMTYLGTGSLYIDLLHPFVLRRANDLGLMSRFDKSYEVVGLLIGRLVLSMILGSKPVRAVFRPLIQPRYT